jgi:Mg2+/citrate symporter
MLLNILLSRLSPYVDEIIGIVSVSFDVTLSTDKIFCIYQVQEKKTGIQ